MCTDHRAPARPLHAGLVTRSRLLAEGLLAVCAAQPDVRLVVPVEWPAVSLPSRDDVDMWLIDAALGPATIRSLLAGPHALQAPVCIINGASDDVAGIVDYIEAGAASYVTAAETFAGLLDVMRALTRSEATCPPQAMASIFRRVADRARHRELPSHVPPLTPRQSDVVRYIARGWSDKEIAEALGIRVSTVKVHVHHLLEKFDVHGRRDVVRHAARSGLLRLATARAVRGATYGA